MQFTSEKRLDDDVLEREFLLDGISGILWTLETSPSPLILMGHPGGVLQMYPRLKSRAVAFAAQGIATATIELPGSGERPKLGSIEQARADLRDVLAAGESVSDDIIDRLVLPLIERGVPEWQTTLDSILTLPEISGPVGYSGGIIGMGVRLAVVEPRISAAGLFAGSFVPRAILDEARQITIPVHVLLQWDDEGNDRNMALALFDAIASREKTLQANMGGHTGVPSFAADDAARFFARHLT